MRRGASLGEVEESFAGRLKPGDIFRFSGKRLEMVRLSEGELIVKAARSGGVAKFHGGRVDGYPYPKRLPPVLCRTFKDSDLCPSVFKTKSGSPTPCLKPLTFKAVSAIAHPRRDAWGAF